MQRYEVRIAASADKELVLMPGMLRQRVIEKFNEIRTNPRGMDSKNLNEATYRVGLEITGSCITSVMRNTQSWLRESGIGARFIGGKDVKDCSA